MVINLKNCLILSIAILAGSLSCWSILLSKKSPELISQSSTHNLPDSYIENVTATIMTKEGKPSLKLETPKMIHYPDDVTEISTPHVIIYRHSMQPWHVNSKYAKAIKGTSQIVFWENVIINHIADKDNPNTTVHTPILTIFPDQQLAKTDEAITFTQPNTTIHAVGMLANLDDGTIKLLSDAREEYVPSSL